VVSNALAPYAAQFIGSQFDPNHGANPDATLQLVSHALLGALLAEANGASAGSGAAVAAGGELAAKFLTDALYGGSPEKLDEQQKQTILALSSAIAALAGGIGGGGLDSSSLGAQIAANVVENNYLSHPQREQRDKEKLACGTDTVCKFAVESRWAELSQDQSRVMKDRYALYLTPEEQAIVFSLKPGTDAYDTLIAHAILRETAENPLFISSLYGGDFKLLTETDWDGPQFNPFTSSMSVSDRNRLEMAVLGPIAGAPSTLASLLGARPETITLTNQLGMIAWDVAGSVAVVGPKSPSAGLSQLRGQSSQNDGFGKGAEVPVAKPAMPSTGSQAEGALGGPAVKSGGYAADLTELSAKQLERKFKHAADFGVVTTKKNPETVTQYGDAIKSHMSSPTTIQQGTYGLVPGSKVFFDSKTNNAVVLDGSGRFVTGFKLYTDTSQYDNFMKNGVLR